MPLKSPVNPSPAGSRAGCIGELALARAGAGMIANDKLVATRMIRVIKNRNDGCRQHEGRDLVDAESWLRGLFWIKCTPHVDRFVHSVANAVSAYCKMMNLGHLCAPGSLPCPVGSGSMPLSRV